MSTDITSRIDHLKNKLMGIARKYQISGMETDDLYQIIVLAMMERSKIEPAFSEQKDSYLCQFAKWTVTHLLEA